ncbi:MAG: CAP domain-containing protein [Myxococcales bacterium]|nr:CAP domain-containing protein [Myxococcales bacterium]
MPSSAHSCRPLPSRRAWEFAALAVLGVAVAAACGGAERTDGGDPADAPHLDPSAPPDAADLARRVHREVNRARRRHGLTTLAWNDAPAAIALGHSRDMAARGYFAHDSPDGESFGQRYAKAGFHCRVPLDAQRTLTGAENLALVSRWEVVRRWTDGREEKLGARGPDALAVRAVDGWLNSPPHRANLLRPQWRTEGIGVVVTADGRVLVTQNFC